MAFTKQALLQDILDHVRNGKQTMDNVHKLFYQWRRFPDVQTDHGIHCGNAAVFKLGSADQRGSATGSQGVRERIPKSSNCLHGL